MIHGVESFRNIGGEHITRQLDSYFKNNYPYNRRGKSYILHFVVVGRPPRNPRWFGDMELVKTYVGYVYARFYSNNLPIGGKRASNVKQHIVTRVSRAWYIYLRARARVYNRYIIVAYSARVNKCAINVIIIIIILLRVNAFCSLRKRFVAIAPPPSSIQ